MQQNQRGSIRGTGLTIEDAQSFDFGRLVLCWINRGSGCLRGLGGAEREGSDGCGKQREGGSSSGNREMLRWSGIDGLSWFGFMDVGVDCSGR